MPRASLMLELVDVEDSLPPEMEYTVVGASGGPVLARVVIEIDQEMMELRRKHPMVFASVLSRRVKEAVHEAAIETARQNLQPEKDHGRQT